MTEIKYFEIEEALATLLRTDERTAKVNGKAIKVVVEETFKPSPLTVPWVGVYLAEWETPEDEEFIANSTHFRTFLTIVIWLYEYSLKHREGAIKRDTLLQKVKEVLKDGKNRQFHNQVAITSFKGGTFETAESGTEGRSTKKKQGNFYKGVSIILKVEVRE